MKNKTRYLCLAPAAMLLSCAGNEKPSEHPNIVVILADDLGYGDISFLNENGKIKTPNVDRLMGEGVVFTDAHSSSAVSTPSRYGLLTGRYNWRSELKQGVLNFYDKPLIAEGRTTMARMLKAQGYSTACFGKWHLGFNFPTVNGERPVDTPEKYTLDFSKEMTGGPVDVGFDHFFGVDCPNYPPYCFIENRKTQVIPTYYNKVNFTPDCRAGRGQEEWDMKKILPTIINKACHYMEQKSKEASPFFVYLPLTSPHTPIVPNDVYKDKSGLNLYADFVMETDYAIGRVLDKLDELGIADNTIVLFSSDNGCSPVADFKFLNERGHDPSYLFRGMKSDLFEGGHHVPCIVRWPEKLVPHSVHQTICLTDFFRTFAAITGYQVADTEGEDSYDISSLLYAETEGPVLREATVHHSVNGSFAIRKGKWKLLMSSNSGGWSYPTPNAPESAQLPPVQLYDLEEDPSEEKNVYDQHPEVVKEMRALLVKYIREGRSTPGAVQKNDGPAVWKQVEWMNDDAI